MNLSDNWWHWSVSSNEGNYPHEEDIKTQRWDVRQMYQGFSLEKEETVQCVSSIIWAQETHNLTEPEGKVGRPGDGYLLWGRLTGSKIAWYQNDLTAEHISLASRLTYQSATFTTKWRKRLSSRTQPPKRGPTLTYVFVDWVFIRWSFFSTLNVTQVLSIEFISPRLRAD